jgi:hypothetical protein
MLLSVLSENEMKQQKLRWNSILPCFCFCASLLVAPANMEANEPVAQITTTEHSEALPSDALQHSDLPLVDITPVAADTDEIPVIVDEAQRALQCEICGKVYSCKNSKERHKGSALSLSHCSSNLAQHTGKNQYPCEACDKVFSRKYNKDDHYK